ncbi:MAG: ATP-dependent protease subunit HslV [Leptospiraceae bacterium]|nr:ATP-dependent protease subunit HslV [Leptospiraceae bacterium]MDW7976894.1 ATP-dependent protease subunit HslV [Leptospiraceae bacterium]
MKNNKIHGTTILCVQKDGMTAIGGDGQISMGNTILKHTAKKIRKLENQNIVVGFAGSTADAITLFQMFQRKVEQYRGNLSRAAVELAQDWRTDKVLRRLEALMIVADSKESYLISGNGDVVASDDGILAIGSGGNYALAAARALKKFSQLDARAIVEESLKIAAEICVFTNHNFTIEVIP